jgi:ABC-type multidrug transport system fused ATPase/permease subunit
MKVPEGPVQTGPAIRRIRRLEADFIRPHRGTILLALAGMMLQSVLLLPLPLLQGKVLDRLAPALLSEKNLTAVELQGVERLIAFVVVGSIACHLGRMALSWKIGSVMARVSQEVVVGLTDALHRKMHRLPMAFFDRQQTGRLMARITSDVGSILIFLSSGFLQLVTDLILASGIVVFLVWIEWRLALVSFLVLPIYALNHTAFSGRIDRLSREVRAELATIYALVSERVSAVRLVRSFSKEDAEVAELDGRIDAYRDLSRDNTRAGAIQSALATLISGLGTVLVITYGAILIGREQLTVGELLAITALLAQLYNPIVRLTQFQAMLTATLVSIERMYQILDEPETLRDRPGARSIVKARGSLSFRDVSFAYSPGGAPVLERIKLELEPGMRLGLLGPSGSGKSTLLSLAPRLYDVSEGSGPVLFDGQDVRDFRLEDLRKSIVLVGQQPILFRGTIRSNLLYANPGATSSQVRRALDASDFAATVDSFPLGLDTPVGERGSTLSGGQRQRLALARALIANPSILLLDDCTSALDAETEAQVQAALLDLFPDRTCLIVSHKLSSVSHADWVAILDEGRIVEQGPPEKLLSLGGSYAKIYDQQSSVLVNGA